MADTPSEGALAKLALDSVLPFDTSSIPFEFTSENLRMVQTHLQTGGIRGSRQRRSHRVRIGTEQITGSIAMQPSKTELDWLLPYILYGSTSLGVTSLAEAVAEFQVMVDRVAKVFTYAGCRVGRATFAGSMGQPLTLSLDIEGETESIGNAGTFPAITIDTGTMAIFSDLTLTLQSSARTVKSFQLVIDHMLDAGRYLNSVTRSEIPAQDLQVTLSCVVPYTPDNTDLLDQAVAGAAGTLAWTFDSSTYTWAFGNLKAPSESPGVAGKSEIDLTLNMEAFHDGTNPVIKCTKS